MLTCLCGDVQCVQSVVGLQRKRREDNLELMLGSCPTCPLSGPCLDSHCPLIYIYQELKLPGERWGGKGDNLAYRNHVG